MWWSGFTFPTFTFGIFTRRNGSIIQDTAALKAQDMSEMGVTLAPWEHRARWYGESEAVAKERAKAVGAVE